MSKELEKKALVAKGRTDASVPAVIGRYVIDPLVMSDATCTFSWRQYRFANMYRKTLDLEASCAESGMLRDAAIRFLRKPQVRAWLDDRAKMQETKQTWSAEGRWWFEGEKMYRAEKVPKHRTEIWREFGDRLEVKPGRIGELTKDSVQINISADVISSIKERERSVEAEIVNHPA